MNVTILGTGSMARAIAARMLAGGNSVTFLSREPDKAAEMVKDLAAAASKGASVKVNKLGSPISDPVVISSLWYSISLEVVKSYGAQLAGKVLVDISNPLNQTYDDLIIPPGTSAAEEIAKVAPKDTAVLKAFNTTFAGLLAQGSVAGMPLDVFIAGDDEKAKQTVAGLIEAGGQRVLDVGPLNRARHLESLGFLSILLQSRLQKPWMSGVKIVD
jgi:8-hydroxy-5-deazaflavin:NADPH oxidoreductase